MVLLFAVRWGTLTIPEPLNDTLYLFNITADPTETFNVAGDANMVGDVNKLFTSTLPFTNVLFSVPMSE